MINLRYCEILLSSVLCELEVGLLPLPPLLRITTFICNEIKVWMEPRLSRSIQAPQENLIQIYIGELAVINSIINNSKRPVRLNLLLK